MSRIATIAEVLATQRVIAVVTIESAADAVPIANALCAGGVRAIEVTLRTESALTVIEHIAKECPAALVGAGTARRPMDFAAARAAGAQFVVSPGFTPALAAAARAAAMPWLPGVATASEILHAVEADLSWLKLFPAAAAGGVSALRAFATVFPDVSFCPTGGIDASNLRDYLALPNVACVGGSWLTPAAAVKARKWPEIQRLAEAATALCSRR